MPDAQTLLFRRFDGNGRFFSTGNAAAAASPLGLLFMDFVTPSRLRLQGTAQRTDDPATVGLWPGAQFAVQVQNAALTSHCARHVPRLRRLQGARCVPHAVTGEQPIPGCKRIDTVQAVLPQHDRHKADTAGGLIAMAAWGAKLGQGDRRGSWPTAGMPE